MLTLLLQIKLVENISCLRIYLIWTNAKNAKHQGGKFDKCSAKKKKKNQPNCHTLALAIFIGKIFFQNRSYAHMVDGWHPKILLSAFKLGPLALFLSWKIKRIFYLNLPPPKGLLHNHYCLCVGCVLMFLCCCWWGGIWHHQVGGACIAWVSQQDFIVPSKETKVTEVNLNADVRILKCQSFFCIRSIKTNIFEFTIY